MAFLNDLTLGRTYPTDSFLHRLDPRSKLIASVILMCSFFIATTPPSLGIQTFICVVGIYFSNIPGKVILKNLKPFVWLFLITFLIHFLTTPGEAVVTIPGIGLTITATGIENGLVFSVRLALLIVIATLLTMTTTPMDLTDGLERMFSPLKRFNVPVHEFALMMTLSIRFIPILVREAERIKNAQLSRGLAITGNLFRRIQAIIPMILPLFISTIRKADELAVAMEARNYTGGAHRTSFRQLRFGGSDYTVLVGSVAFAAMLSMITG